MIKHTPGPWHVEDNTHVTVDSRELVCCGRAHPADGSCCGNPEVTGDYFEVASTSQQDAHLISAAPDLYAACEAALGAFERNDAIDWNILSDALKKARGEPTT